MTFRQLEYLCALVQEGSISKAANKLFISQPALSQQIIAIEQEYDIKILNRTATPVAITEEGMLFYETAEKILALKDEIDNNIRKRKKLKLHIKSVSFYAHTFIPYALSEFRQEWSNVEYKIYDTVAAQLFNGQHYEDIDLYIHGFNMNEEIKLSGKYGEKYKYEILFEEEIILAAYGGNSHLEKLSYRKEDCELPYINLRELKDETFVTTTTSNYLRDFGTDLCKKLGNFDPQFVAGETTFDKLLGVIQFSDCIAFIPDIVYKYYTTRNSNIRFYGIEGSDVKGKVVVSWPKAKKLTPQARAFIEKTKELMRQ